MNPTKASPRAIQNADQRLFVAGQGRGTAKCSQAGREKRFIVTAHAAEQTGQVRGRMIEAHGAVVNNAGDAVGFEKDVIVPDVTQARVQWMGTFRPRAKHGINVRKPVRQQTPGCLRDRRHRAELP